VVIGDSISLCVCVFEMVSNWIFLSHSPFYQPTSRQKQAPLLCEWKNKIFFSSQEVVSSFPFPYLKSPSSSQLLDQQQKSLPFLHTDSFIISLFTFISHSSTLPVCRFRSFSTPTLILFVFSVLASDLTKPCCYFGSFNLISI